jgi:hypothetical protein
VPWRYLVGLVALGVGGGVVGWLVGIVFGDSERFSFGGGVQAGLAVFLGWALNACACLAVMGLRKMDIHKVAGLGEE